MFPIANSAVAPVLEPTVETSVLEQTDTRAFSTATARQVPLFDDRPKIIPFEAISGRKAARMRQTTAVRRQARASARTETATQTVQQPLDLRAPAPRQRKAVADDVPVAEPGLRIHAATIDASFVGAGIVAAAATFFLMGGRLAFSGKSVLPCAVAVVALAVFYHLFWCLLGRDSAGMQSAGLRLLTFDGTAPTWKQRVARFVLSCFGVGAVGMGVLWALIDDEGLTWHDHISKTFPTEYDPTPGTLHRH